MNYIDYTKRLDYILELIRKDSLCSPHELASKFNCSEKTIRNMINVLRQKGHNIKYSKKSKKYFVEKMTEKLFPYNKLYSHQ